ncbi:MAG: MBL fold metallo-hydrolase [Spongiibacteraceae bacterium]|nr:MBL fold metallo-hydrolase [Spongiibacteraceae bacterium]MBN51932.1 MBL fold metallo-hydrolase [Spongiibacteraceae bacterium]
MAGEKLRAKRWLIGGLLVWLVLVSGYAIFKHSGLDRKLEQRTAEFVGDIAHKRIAAHSAGNNNSAGRNAGELEQIPVAAKAFNDFVYIAYGVGNTSLVHTADGNVVIDTGLPIQGAKQKRLLQELAPGRTSHVILSHAHADHSGGTRFWLEPGTEVVTAREFVRKQEALNELEPYFWNRNRLLYPFMPEEPPKDGAMFSYGGIKPTRTIRQDETYRFTQGGVRFEVISTPGAEGLDNICVWLPDHKILFTGDFFGPIFPMVPNLFTLRGEKFRPPVEYMESLEKILALEPDVIIPAHFEPVVGADDIRQKIQATLDATRYIHDQTLAGMNAGKSLWELMKDIHLPEELALTQAHGKVSWNVRSIWEYYATWFRFESTTELYPVPVSAIYSELRELAGGAAPLIRKAGGHFEAGDYEKALHYIEIAVSSGVDVDAEGLRLQVLEAMLARAYEHGANYSETGWLSARIRDSKARLATLTGEH